MTLAGIDAVAINGESVLAAGRSTIFRHELAHVAIHRLASNAVPAWLDEGLATLVEERDPLGFDRATALSILANDPGQSVIVSSDKNLDITDRVVARLKTVAATMKNAPATKPGTPAPAGVVKPKPPGA